MKPQQLRIFASAVFVYAIFGLISAILISDEFDQERAQFLGFFAIPVATAFLFWAFYYPQTRFKFLKTFWIAGALTILSFGWGYVLLLNAISEGQEGVVVATRMDQKQVFDLNQKRGGLGHLYRWRL